MRNFGSPSLRRSLHLLVALGMLFFALSSVQPAAAGRLCCLDEWQGGVCPPGYRLASECGIACENCGTFKCVPAGTFCLQ